MGILIFNHTWQLGSVIMFNYFHCDLLNTGYYCICLLRLAPSLSRMGFDRVYPVYYEISFELETENERDL